MTSILILVIILLAFAIWVLVIFARKEAGKHGTNAKEEFVGICKSAVETASQKEARKQKALAMFQEKQELSNSEIREHLGVSSRTAVRYLDELEREGKIEQVGKIGHAVTYRLK
ncbi:MAG: HTH domain-containing protein [Candidatus Giovannonibacteria bacterium]|nr:MAG: HTH domain-containing protein [Candidatus Giovannonibacteria bacterium]